MAFLLDSVIKPIANVATYLVGGGKIVSRLTINYFKIEFNIASVLVCSLPLKAKIAFDFKCVDEFEPANQN